MAGKNSTKAGIIIGIAVGTASILLADALGAIDLGGFIYSIAMAGREVMTIHVPLWGVLIASFLLFSAVFIHLLCATRIGPEKFTRAKFKGQWFGWEYLDGKPANFVKLCEKCKCEMKVGKCPICGTPRKLVGYPSLQALHDDLESFVKWHIKHGTYKDIMAESISSHPPN